MIWPLVRWMLLRSAEVFAVALLTLLLVVLFVAVAFSGLWLGSTP